MPFTSYSLLLTLIMPLIFNFSYFLYFYSLWMVETFLPVYFKSISISDNGVGLLVGAFAASSSISIIPAGFASDRLSTCSIIRFGILFFIIYLIGLIMYDSFLNLFIFTLIGGLGSTLINIGLSTSFYKGLEEKGRSSKIGSFFLSSSTGYSLGPLSAGYLLHWSNMQSIFIAGLVFTTVILVLSFFMKEKCSSKREKINGLKLSDYPSIFKQYNVILLLLSVSVVGIHLGAEQSSLSLFLKMNLNLPDKFIGIIFACVGLWVGLLIYLSGRIFDNNKSIVLLIWTGMIISGIFQIATAYTHGLWDALTIRLLHTTGDSFTVLCNGLLTSIVFKDIYMGTGVGIVQGFRMGSIFLGAIICGGLNGIYGYHISFIITGILSFLFGISVLLSRKGLQAVISFPSQP